MPLQIEKYSQRKKKELRTCAANSEMKEEEEKVKLKLNFSSIFCEDLKKKREN